MMLSGEQKKKFDEIVRPLIKFLNDNCHPHVLVVIDSSSAELFEGLHIYYTKEFHTD